MHVTVIADSTEDILEVLFERGNHVVSDGEIVGGDFESFVARGCDNHGGFVQMGLLSADVATVNSSVDELGFLGPVAFIPGFAPVVGFGREAVGTGDARDLFQVGD